MAEHIGIQIPSLSLLGSSDSQVLVDSESLSLPSEPPDVRNWFSSYVYESSRLSNFEDCDGFRGNDCATEGFDVEESSKQEENMGDCGMLGRGDELAGGDSIESSGLVNANHDNSVDDDKHATKVLDSSECLLLSEPPDIRNWFSSYVYESPVLDTSNGFGVSDIRESESGREGFDARRCSKDKEENLMEFSRTAKRGEQCTGKKIGFNECSSLIEDSKHEHQFIQKILESSDCLLPSSEPPDIKNWFSSYVYESSATDISDGFGVSDLRESESVREAFNGGKSREGKEENLKAFRRTGGGDELVAGENIGFNGFVKYSSSIENYKHEHQYIGKGNHKVDGSKNSSFLSDLPFRETSGQLPKREREQCHDIGSKDKKNSDLCSLECAANQDRKFSREAGHISFDVDGSSANSIGKSARNLLHKSSSIEKRCEAKALKNRDRVVLAAVNGNSVTKQTGGSSDRQNDANHFAGDGFISTRKSKSRGANDENSLPRPLGVQSEYLTNRLMKVSSTGGTLTRKVLSERTNFQHSDAWQIAGKWQCPQRRKPNLGPPLKQLRLEQWVHRL